MAKIKLSIHCITYNHAPFIRKALDGFVMQKTNFPFEAVIGDDCSTDGTTEIIKEYAAKYPNIIKPIFHNKNTGGQQNYFDVANACSGEYVAMCEGDDYWTDENKLQKQVDFLDSHPECSICFHPVTVKWEDKSEPDSIFPKPKNRFNKEMLNIDDLLKCNFIQTNSCVYRWRFGGKEKLSDVFPQGILPGDYFLHLLHAEKGKIGFIPDNMAVYRKHKGGIWNGCGVTDEWFIRCGLPHIKFCIEMDKRFHTNNFNAIINLTKMTIIAALRQGNFAKLNDIRSYYIDNYNNAIKELSLTSDNRFIKKYRKYKRRFYIVMVITIIELLILSALIIF